MASKQKIMLYTDHITIFVIASTSNRPEHNDAGISVNDARNENGSTFLDVHGNNNLMRMKV